jgi:hypothetical protein
MVAVPVVAVLIIAVVALAALFGGGANYGVMDDMFFLDGDEATIVVYRNGRTATISGMRLEHRISIDGRSAAVLVSDDDNDGNALYYVRGSGSPALVATDVSSFILADSGNGIAYWSNHSSVSNTAELHLFNGRNSTRITSDAHFLGNASNSLTPTAVISPDGKVVFYIGESESNDLGQRDSVAYISRNGNSGERFETRNIAPIAIANGAKFIYYVRENREGSDTFRVRRGMNGESNSLGEVAGRIFPQFNNNYSQVVFNDSGRSFISINGRGRESFSNSIASGFVVPMFSQITAQVAGNSTTIVYGFSDFRGKAFVTADGTYLLTRRLESERLSRTNEVSMTADGKRLVYIRDGAIRSVSATNHNDEEIRIVTDNPRDFVIAGNNIYYVDRHGDLRRSRIRENSGEGSRVMDSVHAGTLRVTGGGTVFFTSNDGDNALFFTNNTRANRASNDVAHFYVGNSNVLYFTDEGGGYYDAHRSAGGGKFNRIAKDIRVANGTLWAFVGIGVFH